MKCNITELASNIKLTPLISFINSTDPLPNIPFNISDWTNNNKVFTI